MRPCFALLVAAALFLFPDKLGAKDLDHCGKYSELTAAQVEDIRLRIAEMVPAKYTKLAKTIDIVTVARDVDHIGPSVVPARTEAGARIEVPNGFRAFQCRLIKMQAFFWWNSQNRPDRVRDQMNLCVANSGGDVSGCLYAVPAALLLIEEARGLFSDEDKRIVEDLSDEAFLALMLHEFAHAALGHLENPTSRSELEADAFALIHQLMYEARGLGVLLTHSALEYADDHVGSDELHGKFLCRAKSADVVITPLLNRLRGVLAWPQLEREPYAAAFAGRLAPSEPTVAGDREERARKLGCAAGADQFVAAVVGDLDALAAALAALDSRSAADPRLFYKAIQAVSLTTVEGGYVRARLIALKLRFLHSEIRSKALEGPNLKLGNAEYLETVDAALNAPDRLLMAGGDYGRLLSLKASSLIMRGEDGDFQASVRHLQDAIYYHPGLALSFMQLSTILLTAAQCDAALDAVDRVLELSPNLEAAVDMKKAIEETVASEGCSRKTIFGVIDRLSKTGRWPSALDKIGNPVEQGVRPKQ